MEGNPMDLPLSGVGSHKVWDTTDASKLWDAVDTDEITRDEIGILARCAVGFYATRPWYKFAAEKFFREAKFEKPKEPEVSLTEWNARWVKDASPVDLFTYVCREMLKKYRQEQANTTQSNEVDATVSLPSVDACTRMRYYISYYFSNNYRPWAELAAEAAVKRSIAGGKTKGGT